MTLSDQQRSWDLAFRAQSDLTQSQIIDRCDEIQALFPDLRQWDPAGRGEGAAPCQWLMDLIHCSGIAYRVKTIEGFPALSPREERHFYIQMACELSNRESPNALLTLDGHTPIPPGVRLGVGYHNGDCQFAFTQGHILDAIFNHWLLLSHTNSEDELSGLILNIVTPLTLSTSEGAKAFSDFVDILCFSEMTNPLHRQQGAVRIAQALLSATSNLDLSSLSLSAYKTRSLQASYPDLLAFIQGAAMRKEAKELEEALSLPVDKAKPAPRV